MARGICLPAVCCAVAALVWLPAASTAQTLDGPEEGVYEFQPLLHDDSPTPQFFGRSGPRGRHRGFGHPLQRESWLYRPFSAGWFMGVMQGGPLIDDWLSQKQGFVGGYRLGWDHDYYWGAEMRFTFASVELYDSRRAIDAQYEMDTEDEFAPHDPYRLRFNQRRDADLFQWDVDVLYYPWGDSQWRPYLMAGLGAAQIGFTDRLGARTHEAVFAAAVAAGLKYRCNDWLALRLECADQVAFGGGSGFNTVHNVSATGGVEVRFGGARTAYWPWNPGRHYW